jgi:hypothetical protein
VERNVVVFSIIFIVNQKLFLLIEEKGIKEGDKIYEL